MCSRMLSWRPVVRLSSAITDSPRARRASPRCDPMNPAPPVISARTGSDYTVGQCEHLANSAPQLRAIRAAGIERVLQADRHAANAPRYQRFRVGSRWPTASPHIGPGRPGSAEVAGKTGTASLRLPARNELRGLLPEDPGPVDLLEWVGDAQVAPVVVDCGFAADQPFVAVVIDNHVAPDADLWVQRLQGVHRRFVHVPIEASDRQLLDRGGGERVPEPALQETHLVVEQPVPGEVALHAFEAHLERVLLPVVVPGVKRVPGRVRLGEPLERVRHPDGSLPVAECG